MINLEAYYSRIREKNRLALEARREECCARCPELAVIAEQRSTVFRLPPVEAVKALKKLQDRQKKLLAALGVPEDWLTVSYDCPLCRDTGYVGDAVRKKCACRLKKEQEELLSGAQILPSETFAQFREDIFPDEKQLSRTLKLKAFCEKYAEELPAPEKPQLLFWGRTGLGKSFLGNAIAARAAERGVESRRITSYAFISEVLASFSGNGDPVAVYSRVPLLVLDDLGAEPLIPNVTEPSLFALVDQRLAAGLPTVYITNLSPQELQDRFNERIASRILQKNRTAAAHFEGESLRNALS